MARIERIVDTVDTFSLIVASLPIETRQAAEFGAEEVYDGDPPVYLHYRITMNEEVADPFDAALANLGELHKAELRRWALGLCREREDRGIVLNDLPLRTDAATRQDLIEATAIIGQISTWSIPWELSDGTSLTIDAASLPPIVAAVAEHRRSTRLIYEAVKAAIAAGTITTMAEIDAAFAA